MSTSGSFHDDDHSDSSDELKSTSASLRDSDALKQELEWDTENYWPLFNMSHNDKYGCRHRYEDGSHYNSYPKFIRKSFWPHWELDDTWIESAGLRKFDHIESKRTRHYDDEYMLWREIGLAFPKTLGIMQPISLTVSSNVKHQSKIIGHCLHRLKDLRILKLELDEDDCPSHWLKQLENVLFQIHRLDISQEYADYMHNLKKWLVKMTSLESLGLYFSSEDGEIGLKLDSLTNLRNIYIESGGGSFDCYIPPLPNLVQLRLSGCTVASIGTWLHHLKEMTALERLSLPGVPDYGSVGQYLPTQLRSLSLGALSPKSSRQLCQALQSHTNLTKLYIHPLQIRDRELQLQWMNWYARSAVEEWQCHVVGKSVKDDMIWPETIPPMKHLRSLDCERYPSWASMVRQHTQLTRLSLHKCIKPTEPLDVDIFRRLTQLQQLSISEPVPAAFYQCIWPDLTNLEVHLNSDDLLPDFIRFLNNHPLITQLELALDLQTAECYMACWKHVVQLPQLVKLTVRILHDSVGGQFQFKLDSISPTLRQIRSFGGYGKVDLPDDHELESFDQQRFTRNRKKHQTLLGLMISLPQGWV